MNGEKNDVATEQPPVIQASTASHFPAPVHTTAISSSPAPQTCEPEPVVQVRKDSLQPLKPAFEEEQPLKDEPLQPLPRVQSYRPPPLPPPTQTTRELTQPPEFNPKVVKTGPLPVPPIDTQNLKRSISRTPPAKYRPRRSSSARGHGRMSHASVATRASTTISPVSSHQSSHYSGIMSTIDTPITNPSIYGSRPPSNFSKFGDSRIASQQFSIPSRHQSSTPSIYPSKSEENLQPLPTMVLPPPPPPRSSMRPALVAQTATSVMSSPPRSIHSRISHRQQDSSASDGAPRGRQPSLDSASYYGSPTSLSRANTITELGSPESYYMPEKSFSSNVAEKSIQSMFPTYDHSVPLQHQSYFPQRAAPIPPTAQLKHDLNGTGSGSATTTVVAPVPSSTPESKENISAFKDLNGLWIASNGQLTTPLSGPFNLKMFKSVGESKKRSKITFGPSEHETFYSLAQAHPNQDEEDEPHEALIFRHHATENELPNPSKDDLIPISHMLVYPPPAATYSKASRHSPEMSSTEAANQISTICPVLATLHALELASRSPQAHSLAATDPKAESPAAARLAERAVRDAKDRENCALSWVRTSPHAGKYELHHPSLGVFAIVVEGDVKAALSSISSSTKARKHASISLINPFASLAYASPPLGTMSPTTSTFRDASQLSAENKQKSVLVKLDFSEEILHLNAPAIQSLGSMYIFDVAVSTILAVAIAESQRADDPGLYFAAPPPSLMLTKVKKGSRIFSSSSSDSLTPSDKKKKKLTDASTVSLVQLVRGTNSKKDGRRTIDWTRTNAIMGIEHLTDVNDLPRITRGILSVLGAGFKTALWLLEFGVRISAKMVIGLTKVAGRV